jgi:tripartite-type tricarboxylate transporter receptor subunit TctC
MRWKAVGSAALAATIQASAPLVGNAVAQGAASWPDKSVKIIVNFAPGGSNDNTMRPFAERLSKVFGQQFVLEHRGGASGAIGLEAAQKSPPDGYTFVSTPSLSLMIVPHLRKTSYDPLTDFKPVSMLTTATIVFAIRPDVPANNMQEALAYIKANPGKLSWGTAGIGSMSHIFIEKLNREHGLNILHVPYRGAGESIQDFLSGAIQIHSDPNTLPHIASGKARLLAVIDRQRHPDYPNVPLLKEILPDFDYLGWFGLFAPKGTPDDIIAKLSAEIGKIAQDPEVIAFHRKVALSPAATTPEELGKGLKSDHERFGKIIRDYGIKVE